MSRLPVPGSDDGIWGNVLNDFLGVEHASDGSLKIRTDGTLAAKLDKSIVTAKGDLLIGTGPGTVTRQTVGVDGQVLVADSAQTSGIRWVSQSFASATAVLGTFAPEAYGAHGDGVTDDTAAVQAAINAAGNAGGGVVRLAAQYLISSTLVVNRPNILLQGAVSSFWNTAQSQIIASPSVNGAVLSITASGCGVAQLTLRSSSGTASVTAVALTGTSTSQVQGFVAKDVYITNLGGVAATYVNRSKFDGVNVQGWNGGAGFSVSNCQLIYFRDCNSAAGGTGTASTWTYDWYFSQCETMVLFNCEANNAPYYGFYLNGANDSKWYDIEFNGATYAQLYAVNCTDNQFVNPYCLGESTTTPTGMSFYNCSVLLIDGAWIGDSSGDQVILKSCNNVHLANSTVFTNGFQNAVVLTDDGGMGNSDIVIANCNLNGDNGLGTAISLGGTAGGDSIQVSGCIIHAAGQVGSVGYSLNNPGLNLVTVSGGSVRGVATGIDVVQAPNHLTLFSGVNMSTDVTLPCALPLPTMIKMVGCINLPSTPNAVSADYTFQLSDTNIVVEGNSSTALTFTVPAGVFPVGTLLSVFQEGSGRISIVGAAGVSVWSPDNHPSTTAQYQTMTLRQRDVNVWVVQTPVPLQLQNPTQTANNYTFQASDAGTVVEGNSSTTLTFTVPANVFALGTVIKVFQVGNGGISISGASGVTLWGTAATSTQYTELTLRQRDVNVWAITTG